MKYRIQLATVLLLVTTSPAVFGARHSVKDDRVVEGGPTYGECLRALCETYVFPKSLKYNGVGAKRDRVVVETVDRDGNKWWLSCRARYSGDVLGVGFAERARVKYDNGEVSVSIGKLKGKIPTSQLQRAGRDFEVWIRKHIDIFSPKSGDVIKSGDRVFFHTRTSHEKTGFHYYLNAAVGRGDREIGNGKGVVLVVPNLNTTNESDESWWIEKVDGSGPINSGDKVFLRTRTQRYLNAAVGRGDREIGNGKGVVLVVPNANRTKESDEIWWIEKVDGDGQIRSGEKVFLRTRTQRYLNAAVGRGDRDIGKGQGVVLVTPNRNDDSALSDEIWWIRKH